MKKILYIFTFIASFLSISLECSQLPKSQVNVNADQPAKNGIKKYQEDLKQAIQDNDVARVEDVIFSLNKIDHDLGTISEASKDCKSSIIEGTNSITDYRDSCSGYNFLHYACLYACPSNVSSDPAQKKVWFENRNAIIEKLIAAGVDIHQQGSNCVFDYTPIHLAAESNPELLKPLFRYGGNVEVRNHYGCNTPLYHVIKRYGPGYLRDETDVQRVVTAVKILCNYGADVNAIPSEEFKSETPLNRAARSPEIFRAILPYVKDLNKDLNKDIIKIIQRSTMLPPCAYPLCELHIDYLIENEINRRKIEKEKIEKNKKDIIADLKAFHEVQQPNMKIREAAMKAAESQKIIAAAMQAAQLKDQNCK